MEKPTKRQPDGKKLKGVRIRATAKAVVNIAEAARRQAETPADLTPGTFVPPNQPVPEEESSEDDLQKPSSETPLSNYDRMLDIPAPEVTSPSPTVSFLGHSDVPKIGTGTIVIPADTTGAVGTTDVVTFLNNNYVVQNKLTGAPTLAVSEDTFWTGIGATGPFDPRIVYDPYNNRWIVAAVSDAATANSSVLIGVSQTSNPAGAYFLFRFDFDSTNRYWADFPTIGFNKNWIAVNVNSIFFTGAAAPAVPNAMFILDYPQLRTGVVAGARINGTGFVTAPAITYSATENTLYNILHLSSGGATYRVDQITGTPAAPVYTTSAVFTRPGGGWVQPSGQILPQAAPLAGASVCGATPCPLEAQDAQIRSSPVFRGGNIWYTQTIGLPAGAMTHTAVQWSRITTAGAFVEGGRVDDPTATSTNGGKWYAYPAIAVNANLDVLLGFSQFASNQYVAAGYTFHKFSDAAGTMQDPLIYKAGEDYYSKTFGTGRNRWGDYSAAQVDPTDDLSLWTLQEYAMLRVGIDDGNTGANSSRWSTWWAKVSLAPSAASVVVGGRVQTADGRAIPRAVVTLTDASGATKTSITNPFGRYQFEGIQAGGAYVLNVTAKGYQFATQVVTISEDLADLDLTAQP